MLWVGPLRSDYTRQLIRSRIHLVRILIMYGLVAPFALLGLLVAMVAAISRLLS